MKEVNWIGETKMVPGYGMGTTGKPIILPVDIADSFIKQGLAKAIVPSAKKQTKKESE